MGRHRKPNTIKKWAYRAVPVVVLSSALLASSTSHANLSNEALAEPLRPVTVSAVSAAPTVVQVPFHLPPKPPAPPRPVETFNQRVISEAKKYLGVPYVYGGDTPSSGFDCSGLVHWVYSQEGHYVPRTADEQFHYFRMIPRSAARPGDLVFFHDSSNPSSYVYHVGIYDGGDIMIVAPHTGTVVKYQDWTWGGSDVTFGTLDIR